MEKTMPNSEKLRRIIIAKIKKSLDTWNTYVDKEEFDYGGPTGEKRIPHPDFDNLSDKQLVAEFEKALFVNVDVF
jgi:hypothetical protein